MSFFEFPHTRTYDTDLGWLIKNANNQELAIKALEEWKEATQPTLEEMKYLYEQILSGNFPPEMITAIETWLIENGLDILGEMAKMVFFAINNDGYFVAYIPESWDDIIFNTTGLDITIPGIEYGHLVLSY